MFKRVLVPLDGSEAAEIVLPYVQEIAGRGGAQVEFVSVSEARLGDADTRHLYGSYLEQLTGRVRQRLWELGAGPAVEVRGEVLIGRPADEILRYAEFTNASLIVMASRGASGEGPWLLGNIAAKVLRATGKPVVLVRASLSEPRARKQLVKRILVPLDGSLIGAAAIPFTEELAHAMNAEIVLLHSVQPVSVVATLAEVGTSLPEAAVASVKREEAAAYLDSIKNELGTKRLKASTVVCDGSPAEQIIDYARTNAIDLIAMSSHGRTGIGRWVFGSVTDKVLHAGDLPVLVVRATKP